MPLPDGQLSDVAGGLVPDAAAADVVDVWDVADVAAAVAKPAMEALSAPSAPSASSAADALAGPALDVVDAAAIELQGFMIGTHRFLVNYLDAVEIEEAGRFAKVPAAPVWMAGLINLHGNVMAVIDLHSLLPIVPIVPIGPIAPGAPGAPAGPVSPMLLVLRHRQDRIALLIDGMTRRMRFTAADVCTGDVRTGDAHDAAAPPPLYASHIVRSLSDGAALWHELDFVALIDGLEAVAA